MYARRYFDSSATFSAWNHLRAVDLHALRELPEFEGQNIYFHNNHPIRYVSLTGLASQIELAGGNAADKLCFIHLDDGSGELVNLKIKRRSPTDQSAVHKHNTFTEQLDIIVHAGLPQLLLDNKPLQVGQVVRARGTIEKWRGRKQIEVKRIKLIKSTADEVQSWTATAHWKTAVLDKPWILTDADREAIDRNIEADERMTRAKRVKTSARQAKQEAKFNAGALPGSGIVKAPWD